MAVPCHSERELLLQADLEGEVPAGEQRRPGATSRGLRHSSLALTVSLLCVVAWVAGRLGVAGRAHAETPGAAKDATPLVLADARQLCAAIELDTDYVYKGDWMQVIPKVPQVERCCALCNAAERCHAWSWGRDGELHGQCWLKAGTLAQKYVKLGVISGTSQGLRQDNVTSSKAEHHLGADTLQEKTQVANTSDNGTAKDTVEGGKDLNHTEKSHPKDPEAPAPNAHVKADPVAQETQANRTAEVKEAKPDPMDKYENCTERGAPEGCLESRCCKDSGYQCYTKDGWWAECLVSCAPGPNFVDQLAASPWACRPLGNRTLGEPKQCSKDGANCVSSKCCLAYGGQCFAKNATWAECKAECTPGVDMAAEDPLEWTCKALGRRTANLAPWVTTQCAQDHMDCSKVQCCATPGKQCYKKDAWWGECQDGCQATEWNACTEAGPRTPAEGQAVARPKGKVGPWVQSTCAGNWGNCSHSHCCLGVDAQCYRKDSTWAECRGQCSTAPDPADGNRSWSCEVLGPRSWGLATKGYPSLYCCSLYMPGRYEGPLMKAHVAKNAGIFACDGYDVYAEVNDTLGTTQDGILVEAILIPKIDVGVSQDGTAGNAKLFMAFWDTLIARARFRYFDFTAKVDPDAVLVAWRLRTHMEQHIGRNIYVVNCDKFPGSPNFPMMYGALEVFSFHAMSTYAEGSWKCGQQLPWQAWGEDYYMTHCMDYLHVGRVEDFTVLGDNTCSGSNCGDWQVAAFHPYKSEATWMSCWDQAMAR